MNSAHPLAALFSPRSVALVGASSDPAKLGGRPLRNLLAFGYEGRIYPVNARAAEVQGVKAYPSVAVLPETVDQAIIVVPAQAVEAALADCAARGVKVAQILSAGFAEVGGDGTAMQARVVDIARRAGIRITGPNALGSVSPSDRFFATFSGLLDTLRPEPGVIGVATQSGAFGSHIYATMAERGIGLSRSLATGNEADIDVAEAIGFLAADPATRVICAALEGCRNGARLRASLRAAAEAGKPVVIMKVGRTEVGAVAAATHTGSLAGEDRIFDAVFRAGGAWRAETVEEMVDIAYVCATGRMPVNRGTTIVTISGGLGVLMADTAVEAGLDVAPMPAALGAEVRAFMPLASGRNPIDTTAGVAGGPPSFARLFDMVLSGSESGSVLAYLAHIGRTPARFAELEGPLAAVRAKHPDRLIALAGTIDPKVRKTCDAMGVPFFEDPSRLVRATAAAAVLRERMALARQAAVADASVPPAPRAALNEAEAKAYLAECGVPVVPERSCATADEAVAAAEAMGFPVVAKILSPDILHKTEIGGVTLNLRDADEVSRAFADIVARARAAKPDARIEGVLISPMLRGGVETIIGIQRDPVFGPMVMFGLGGVSVELFRDVAFAPAPLDQAGAERLIGSVRGARLLEGWRGAPPADRAALVRALVRVSQVAAAHPDTIAGIDINPFLVMEKGAYALDAVIVTHQQG